MARRIAIVLAVACIVYGGLIIWRGWDFVTTGQPAAVGLGVAVVVIALISGIVVVREMRFGYRMQRLGQEAAPPATEDLEELRVAAGADGAGWQDWYWVGIAMYQAGEKKQARAALEHAWYLHAH